MSKYYILSGMDEERDYNFYKNISEIFKNELNKFDTIVYISAYPKDYEKNDKLSKSERFLNIGIKFKRSIAVDYSYSKEQVRDIITKSDLIFLYGGDPYQQMKFILDYDIKEFLNGKTLITLSAGSINISKEAICTKDEDFDTTSKYERTWSIKL